MDAIFFPRKDYDVVVCQHRLGKKMTYTDCTDQLQFQRSYDWITAYAKSKGIKLSFFGRYAEFPTQDFVNKALPDLLSGHIWLDTYSYAPNIASKITGGGTITQEEWNTAYNDYVGKEFIQAVGKKPVALSYSYNNTTFADFITQYLGGRKSGQSHNITSYGIGCGNPDNVPYSFESNKALINTFQWWDEVVHGTSGVTFAEEIQIVANKIDETILNGGWIRNFTHYHSVYDSDTQPYEDYLDMLSAKNANGEIYFSGYGEALAYLVYRQLITRAVMYSPNAKHSSQLVIRLEAHNTLGVDTDLLQIPISIKFSTVGTPLAGKNIASNCNLISLGGGDYIVEIPYMGRFPYAIINEVKPLTE